MALFSLDDIKETHRKADGRFFDGGKQPGCGPWRWGRKVYTLPDGSALFVESSRVWGMKERTYRLHRAYENGEIVWVESDVHYATRDQAHGAARREQRRLREEYNAGEER